MTGNHGIGRWDGNTRRQSLTLQREHTPDVSTCKGTLRAGGGIGRRIQVFAGSNPALLTVAPQLYTQVNNPGTESSLSFNLLTPRKDGDF